MTVLMAARRLDARWVLASAVLGAGVGAAAVGAPLAARAIAGVSVLAVYAIVALRDRGAALALVFTWLLFLGLLRRGLIPILGWPAFDPLLLLAPACAVVLWVTARERVRATGMSATAVVLALIVGAQAANPLNEDAFSAVLALLFWAGPLLWFFVGRTVSAAGMQRLLRVVTVLLVPVIAHGLLQSFGFFLPFEYTWVGVSGFGDAIFLEGFKIRPFSTLVSPQEYGYVLSFGLMVVWARLLHRDPAGRALVALFVVGVAALFLQASRGIFLFFVVALLVSTSVRLRALGPRLVLWSLVGLLAVGGAIKGSAPAASPPDDPPAGSSALALARHQVSGFLSPETSTLPLHRTLVADAFAEAARRPFGTGLAEGSLAEQKGRGDASANPENDIATVFLALGLPGGIAFALFMIAGLARAVRAYRTRGDWLGLAAIGVCVAFLTQWWSGQMYAASALLWVMLGWLSRPREDADAA